jgi:hypothetical protein
MKPLKQLTMKEMIKELQKLPEELQDEKMYYTDEEWGLTPIYFVLSDQGHWYSDRGIVVSNDDYK